MPALLRQRNFALLWFGQLISIIGDWLLWIALPFFVYEQTGSALATGAMFTVQILPSILFGSLAGVFVDRWDRKRTMVTADVLRAIVLLLFLLAARFPDWLWIVYPTALIGSTISQFFDPAKSAIIPTLVNKQNLMEANALISFSSHLASLVGPGLGGILFGWVRLSGVVFIDFASFLSPFARYSKPTQPTTISGASLGPTTQPMPCLFWPDKDWLAFWEIDQALCLC